MRWSFRAGGVSTFVGTAAFLVLPALASGQDSKKAGTDKEVQAINDAYDAQRLQAERRRLEGLAQLAAQKDPAAAAAIYEQIFRLAITNNLFGDAASTAELVVKDGSPSPTTIGLANLVKIIAECDRGAHEQSLASLRRILEGAAQAGGKPSDSGILTSEKIELCDLYYQRLVHGDQLEIARKAFQLLKEHTRVPAVAEFVSSRLKRLELVGKPAPAIQGANMLDGKPFDLANAHGKVVLVVFWASWCIPCASEIETLQQVADAYRAKGFQLVGINLDTLQDDGQKLETVMPNIRHFLLDYNVTWPTLINGTGDKNYAEAYGVTAIPSNTLIGRDGKVIHLDLVPKNLEAVIARVTAQ